MPAWGTLRAVVDLPLSPLGLHLLPGGTSARAAVLAAHAEAVEVVLLDGPSHAPHARQRRVPLARARHGVWTGLVGGVGPGQRYGLRVDGPWDPRTGHRHDPSKLLLDPWARGVGGEVAYGPEVFSHAVDPATWEPLRGAHPLPGLDSAASVRHGVLLGPSAPPPPVARRRPWSQAVVYEAHPRGLTMLHPDVPRALRGTYAALGHPAVVEHLVSLGVTVLELLPVHAAADEVHLARRGAHNYWGYSTLSYLAPEPRYATAAARAAGAGAVAAELAGAVAALHAAGVEVVLDVVYNHTCEAGAGDGPTLSLRGLDAATYYRLDGAGHDADSTGCGNSLDFSHPRVVELALGSLRHWVQAYGVDGFRFDLAPTLARGADGSFRADHPFLVAAAADPVLSGVHLVAEPWDLGPDGWRTGGFPAPFAEWDDRFRDAARTFWLDDARRLGVGERPGHGLSELATRMTGSADLFAAGDRGPLASVNLVTAHDGFTLADLCAFEHKHNEANGEGNRDGSDNNSSWNHGEEGWHDGTEDPDAALRDHLRRRSMRNLLATLLLSAGVPMITAGDEGGRSQGGNNNPYCLDSPLSWVGWDLAPWQQRLLASTTELLRLRAAYPQLRPSRAPTGRAVAEDGTTDRAWFDADGRPMTPHRWQDPGARTVQMFCHGAPAGHAEAVLLVVHGGLDDVRVTLPGPPWGTAFTPLWDSAVDPRGEGHRPERRGRHRGPAEPERPPAVLAPGGTLDLSALSVRLLEVTRG